MQKTITRVTGALAIGSMLLMTAPALAAGKDKTSTAHSHSHDHSHGQTEAEKQIYKGYFEDAQVKPRMLSDWEGDWQSVYPYLLNGSLDGIMAEKAAHGDKTAAEYRAYYEIGYKTDVNRITIKGDNVAFYKEGKPTQGTYVSDGQEILTYKKGNRGVRYIFKKTGGDADAPQFIQFSDHTIAPKKAGHYHLYWGNDRKALLDEVTNWPTYYPFQMDGPEIVEEMAAH
ncbi:MULTISPECIES: metal-binding protein ZinT [Rhizobium/Agrobacterium group]|jgi:zinc transport system substrate-binding protein|uniref:ZinT family metal-binding protein n=1 Tax=Agrobacterium tumefaciens TaxID=358 RepID=A0AA86FW30_AGRTU|nr:MULTISPECIES: metal-binding protein ZinT [Rhizobium/Agrobacterium group]AHK00924.1 putative zinc-binding lipoprotein ZinT [Agrobacterium tumefaciens LBA4213 (Ach5)]AKC06744.1 zinc transport system substrate-binding protein [Agrobacterium tumefaciens]MDP9559220.1 zinc transport system substrate-binding protein [Rhizobium nepotum]AYM15650.1 zinc transport system substrate-binding protein [Agrobacterium tumefaciens]AYM66885.1 zinc transport system substrate-binding protein [Agrobacterium tumef